MQFHEETVKKNYIYKGKIITVRCDDAVLSNGKECKREVVEHPGGACVLAAIDGKIALVKQFRYAYGEELWELPAGKLDKEGEDSASCAIRELSEETGLIAQKVTLLHTLYPTPGYTNEKLYVYLAEGVSRGDAHLDEGEFLNVEYFPLDEVVAMIERGEINDAKTIVGIYRYILMQK